MLLQLISPKCDQLSLETGDSFENAYLVNAEKVYKAGKAFNIILCDFGTLASNPLSIA